MDIFNIENSFNKTVYSNKMPAPQKKVLTQKEKDAEAAQLVAARKAVADKQREIKKKQAELDAKKAAAAAAGHVNVNAPNQAKRLEASAAAKQNASMAAGELAVSMAVAGIR